jgi:hypothetical protein
MIRSCGASRCMEGILKNMVSPPKTDCQWRSLRKRDFATVILPDLVADVFCREMSHSVVNGGRESAIDANL